MSRKKEILAAAKELCAIFDPARGSFPKTMNDLYDLCVAMAEWTDENPECKHDDDTCQCPPARVRISELKKQNEELRKKIKELDKKLAELREKK